jgi:hypothetical protein
MARSHKKRPFYGIAMKRSSAQKWFRSSENRAKRKKVKQLLTKALLGLDVIMPHEKEYGNEWASPRDGKVRLDHWKGLKRAWIEYEKMVKSSFQADIALSCIKVMRK